MDYILSVNNAIVDASFFIEFYFYCETNISLFAWCGQTADEAIAEASYQ